MLCKSQNVNKIQFRTVIYLLDGLFDLRILAMMFRPTFLVASVVAKSLVRRVQRSLQTRCQWQCDRVLEERSRPWRGQTRLGVLSRQGLERSGALYYPKCKQAAASYSGWGRLLAALRRWVGRRGCALPKVRLD